jgi:hypothetical protein
LYRYSYVFWKDRRRRSRVLFALRMLHQITCGGQKVGFHGVKDTLVFITQAEGLMAFVEPTVNESKVAFEVWEEWKSRPLPLQGWCREFQAVETTDDNQATFEDIKKETRFLDSADEFRTPAKRKQESDGTTLLS